MSPPQWIVSLLFAGLLACGSASQSSPDSGPTDCQEPCSDASPLDASSLVGVESIAAGFGHTCAVLDNGAVRCWGDGRHGRLGYGNTNTVGDDEVPAAVGDVDIGPVRQLTLGERHTCALLMTGAVRCWGFGEWGFLGYMSTENIGDDESPASVNDIDLGGVATQITSGMNHNCALLENGSVRCWGHGLHGQLGYGDRNDIGDDESPASAGDIALGGIATQISAGYFHTCALLEGGEVRCWGQGDDGRLGYGNSDDVGADATPESAGVVNVGGTVTQISAGGAHTCALLDTGSVRCWGLGQHGQLGYGNMESIGDNELPVGDVDVGGLVIEIRAGSIRTCALLENGAVRCWGSGGFGQLGHGNQSLIGDDETPASAGDIDIGGTVIEMATGRMHTCVIMATGSIRCWGQGGLGQLGYGNKDNIGDNELPASAGDVQAL